MAVDLKQSIRSLPIVRQSIEQKNVVVAIDFGTTYSGYAFSFHSDFLENPLNIHVPTWSKGTSVGIKYETPTCALFTPKQEFHSFGYDAEEKYSQLANDSEHNDWYYFRRFKMMLYDNPNISTDVQLRDDKGMSMTAMMVFSKSIEYLKDQFFAEFARTKDNHPVKVETKDIHWVLTVPAIWNDQAKQFMREAAVIAGIPTDRLSIALEPEAASLFCRYLPIERVEATGGSGPEIRGFGPQDKYLILDAGGGTIDITVHEIQDDETVKELYAANGGQWGGTTIDQKFEELLNDIIGPDTMEDVAFRHKDDYLDLMGNFEINKRLITPESTDKITIRIPLSVSETYKELNDNQEITSDGHLKDDLQRYVTFKTGKLQIEADIMRGLYAETCEAIVNHTQKILNEPELRDVDKILMVGGFSESKMLRDAMKKGFPDKTCITPEDVGLAVLKGAVTFGQCPTMIQSRVWRHTYGIRALRNFQPGLDRPERRIVKKIGDTNYFLCENTFSIHATKGESIQDGESRRIHEYVPSEVEEKRLKVAVYRSPRKMPVYTDEESSEWVGDLNVVLDGKESGLNRTVAIEMVLGGTELKMQVVENETKKKEETFFNCLKRESYA